MLLLYTNVEQRRESMHFFVQDSPPQDAFAMLVQQTTIFDHYNEPTKGMQHKILVCGASVHTQIFISMHSVILKHKHMYKNGTVIGLLLLTILICTNCAFPTMMA